MFRPAMRPCPEPRSLGAPGPPDGFDASRPPQDAIAWVFPPSTEAGLARAAILRSLAASAQTGDRDAASVLGLVRQVGPGQVIALADPGEAEPFEAAVAACLGLRR